MSTPRTPKSMRGVEAIANSYRERVATPAHTAAQRYARMSPKTLQREYNTIRLRTEGAEKGLVKMLVDYDEDIAADKKISQKSTECVEELKKNINSWESDKSALQIQKGDLDRKIEKEHKQIFENQRGIDQAATALDRTLTGKHLVEQKLGMKQREMDVMIEELSKLGDLDPEESELPSVNFGTASLLVLQDFCKKFVFPKLSETPSQDESIAFRHLMALKVADLQELHNTLSYGRILFNDAVKSNFTELQLGCVTSRQSGREGMLIGVDGHKQRSIAEIIAMCVGITIPPRV